MTGLLPETAVLGETAAASSRTWRFDPDSGRIGGWIDGEEALRQAVLLRLLTPRYEHMIYSFGYGSELAGLIGKDGGYVQAAVPAMVEEALLRDERILAVRDVNVSRKKDAVTVSFTAEASWGAFSGETEISG
ncbi:MAG: DUF2634 domain-containing protein [Candidatus Merdivicinus sp.]|jgi:hypothetical protein